MYALTLVYIMYVQVHAYMYTHVYTYMAEHSLLIIFTLHHLHIIREHVYIYMYIHVCTTLVCRASMEAATQRGAYTALK